MLRENTVSENPASFQNIDGKGPNFTQRLVFYPLDREKTLK